MIVAKCRFLLTLGLFLLSFRGRAWFNGNRDTHSHRFPESRHLFSSVGNVVEIPDGSMETFKDLLQKSEINFVLFYAPWCGQSWNAAQEFNKAANILYKEVSFIAINCWTGTCSQQQRVDLFPKLVAIHTHFDGMEYKGEHRTSKMIAFLHSVIRPFVYIGSNAELTVTKKLSQEVLIGYFNQTMINTKKYSTFFSLALQFSAKASGPLFKFVVVTSAKLALKAGVDDISQVAYHCLSQAVLKYPSSNHFTIRNLTRWIDTNRCELVIQLSPSADRKEYYLKQLNKGPALILFLPLKLYMDKVNQHLLEVYINAAAQYFNCSCNRTRIKSVSQKSEGTQRNNTAGTSVEINLDDFIASDSSNLGSLKIINSQGDILITNKEFSVPYLFAPLRNCQSFKVQKQSDILENKYNICNVCHKFRNMAFGLPTCLKSSIVSTLSSFTDGCTTIKPLYYPLPVTTICCSVQLPETSRYLDTLEQIKTASLESLASLERSFDDVFNELLSSFVTPLKRPSLKNVHNQVSRHNLSTESPDVTKNILSHSAPLQEHHTPLDNSSIEDVGNNTCVRTGHVTQFAGAGCHSNRSVNFFLMDSTEYWGVAERLGVHRTPQLGKVALVIADAENDAQYVMEEELEISNSSIVTFVMAYMAGNLTRRFRSGRASSRKCPSSQSCVVEVVTSNFDEIVLDETKDVLLLYYTPWCGYCQALGPVLLTVARFFQNMSDVIIASTFASTVIVYHHSTKRRLGYFVACRIFTFHSVRFIPYSPLPVLLESCSSLRQSYRINADENDLPWELYISRYPTFLLFPAYRKDFSVRFSDSIERTAANLIRFLFEHGVKTRKAVEDFCQTETVREQIIELGISLSQVEEEKRLIECKLREAVRTKELWTHRGSVALKGLKQAEDELTKERELRMAAEHLNENLERQRQQVEEKVIKLVASSKNILNDLGTSKAKLNEKEKQLTRLSLESRRILEENEELLQLLKEKETALQGEKKVVVELQNSLIALRRRTTYLEFSNNILRTRLKTSNSKA